MSTVEKLFVQLFDRKRQIIEQLKHRKQLCDQHLLSKLLIQGIPPPPWLLNSDSHSSTSDLTALNKEELIAGLLLPKPEPYASYRHGPRFIFDKPAVAAAESSVPDENCAVNSASSNGIDEDGPGVAPLCHVDGTEAMADIAPPGHGDEPCGLNSTSTNFVDEDRPGVDPPCHVDGTKEMVGIAPSCHVDGSMDTFSYVPMSPEDQTDTRFLNACQLEQSQVRLLRSRSRQKALELRNSAKASAKSCLGMENSVDVSSGSKTRRSDVQLDGLKKSLELAEPSALAIEPCSGKEVAVESSLNSEGSHEAKQLTSGDGKMGKNSSVYGGRLTGSKSSSRQPIAYSGSRTCGSDEHHDKRLDCVEKSPELVEPFALPAELCSNREVAIEYRSNTDRSQVASGGLLAESTGSVAKILKSRDGEMVKSNSVYGGRITRSKSSNNQAICSHSGSKPYRFDKHHAEQSDGLIKSLELAEPSALLTEPCSNKDSLNRKKSCDGSGGLLPESTGSEENDAISGDGEMKKNSIINGRRITRSKSSSQQPISAHSGSIKDRYNGHLDGSSGSLKLVEPSRLPTEIFSKEGEIGNFPDMVKSIDARGTSFTRSTSNKDKEVEEGGSQKTEEHSNIRGSRITRARSSCQQSVSGVNPSEYESDDVCVGRMTRSRSGKTQQTEISIGNNKAYNITRSRSRQSVGGAHFLEEKSNEIIIGGMTRSTSPKAQEIDIAIINDSACSGKISRSISCEAEASNLRSMFLRGEPVKPQQLDFDEVDESNLCNAPIHLPVVQASFSNQEEEVGGFKRPELEVEVNMLSDFNCNHAMDGSWPCYKRRKIESQNVNKSASPTLRASPFHAVIESLPNRNARGEKESILPTSQHMTSIHTSVASSLDCAILVKENDQSVTSLSREHVPTPQMQCEKYIVSSGRTLVASTCEGVQSSKSDVSDVSQSVIVEPSDSVPEGGEVNKSPPSAVFFSGRVLDALVKGQDVVDGSTASSLMYIEGVVCGRQSRHGVDKLKFSIGSPQMEPMNVTEADQIIPEFEGFIIGENTADAQKSQDELEQICISASSSTPVSPFPTACKSYLAPGIYSSVPSGLLENNGLRSNLLPRGSALLSKSHSDMFSFPGSHYGWDSKKPFLSPVGKSFDGTTAKSGGSDKLGNSDLELTCFPIMEDPESSEEDAYDAADAGVKQTESTIQNSANSNPLFDHVQCESSLVLKDAVERVGLGSVSTEVKGTDSCTGGSSEKEPVCDITVQCNSSLAPEDPVERVGLESVTTDVRRTDSTTKSGDMEPLCDINMQSDGILPLDNVSEGRTLESISTEINVHEMHDSKNSSMGQRRSRQTKPGKENKGFSVGANSSKKHSKTLSSRFSKPKLSGQSSLRSSQQSVLEKEQKRNNIVSSVKSFLPLVQQKQASAAAPEKRDLKVKALQAAEAAKRAAEIRENERQQKKEAMKLERARVEQENVKKLELKKKLKEEQRKKREAENAAKKRQRDEEERKEKERKKRRIEEARLQHKQAEEKLHAWKEESSCLAEDVRAHQEKDTNEKTEKQLDDENERHESRKPEYDSIVVENDQREADVAFPTLNDDKMSMGSSATGKVSNTDMAGSLTPNVDNTHKPSNQTSQSYDLSPYQDSDNEGDEEDEVPNKKFIPSWASKSNVASALSSLQLLDPDVIFPPGNFCSLEEVLLPRRLQQK